MGLDVLFPIFGLFDFRFLIFCLFGVLIFWVLDFFMFDFEEMHDLTFNYFTLGGCGVPEHLAILLFAFDA